MVENASPVDEKVQSSTPVARIPRATGKEERECLSFIECSTIDERSPCGSAVPERSVNFLCLRSTHGQKKAHGLNR